MFRTPYKDDFLAWQIWWYSKRMTEEGRPAAKEFLSGQLKLLLK